MRLRWAYPANWPELARACKEQAGWRCEACGIAHGAQVVSRRTGEVRTVVLAAAHVDHDFWNQTPRLRALCPRCHARYDASREERVRRVAQERERHQWLVQRKFVRAFVGRSPDVAGYGGAALLYVCEGCSSRYDLVGRAATFDDLRALVAALPVGTECEVQLWFSARVVGVGRYQRVARGVAVVSEDAVAAGLFHAGLGDGSCTR